MSEWGNPPL